MFKSFVKTVMAYCYPVLARISGHCSWSTKTFGSYISPFWHVNIGTNTIVAPRAILRAGMKTNIKIGKFCYVHPYAMLLCYNGNIELGDFVSINSFCVLYGHGELIIGNNVRIAAGTIIAPVNHVFSDPNKPIRQQGIITKGIIIKDDVWIGANSTILDGVTIGRGSVIGAGSVVTTTIEPYSIAVGVPCKVVKKRE